MRKTSLLRVKLIRHYIAILYLSGLSEKEIALLGFPYNYIRSTLADNKFMELINNMLIERSICIGLLCRIHGLNIMDGIYPLPYLHLSLPQYPTLYGSIMFYPDWFPEINQVTMLCNSSFSKEKNGYLTVNISGFTQLGKPFKPVKTCKKINKIPKIKKLKRVRLLGSKKTNKVKKERTFRGKRRMRRIRS